MKYLIKVRYSPEGARGLLKEGGTARRAVVDKLTSAFGGKTEAFYFAFGEDDAFVIADLPDTASAVSLALAVNASGAVHLKTVPLITCEEMDAASHKSVAYRAPGA
jgi:uncharacterized protein with GYD domain